MFEISPPLLSDEVTVEDHLTDGICLLRDGGVFALFKADGVPWETADDVIIASRHERLNLTLRNLAAPELSILVYHCRGAADPRGWMPPGLPSVFARKLDHAYRDKLQDGQLYQNRRGSESAIFGLRGHAETVGL